MSKINIETNFTVDMLGISQNQISSINRCFSNKEILDIIKYEIYYDYKSMVLTKIFNYNYDDDINNNIFAKIVRQILPSKYIKSLLNLKFFSSSTVYILVIKIYNNIMIINNLIDRITYRSVLYIVLFIMDNYLFLRTY